MEGNEEKGEKNLEASLVELGLLDLTAQSRIKELAAMKLWMETLLLSNQGNSIGKVTEDEFKGLHAKMRDMAKLKQKYEGLIKGFNVRYRRLAQEDTKEVNKTFHEFVDAYYKIKMDVERLLKSRNQDSNAVVNLETEPALEDAEASTDENPGDKDIKEEAKEEGHAGLEEQGEEKTALAMTKRIAFGVVIALVFYGFLGLVIKFVSENMERNAMTSKARLLIHAIGIFY